MPLTRRSSSKSPLPPSQHAQHSPRPFLPPSHYAAAAGIAYYPKSAVVDQHDFQGKVDDHYASAFMPVAYPSDVDTTSESSTDSKANSSPEEKPHIAGKSNQRGRRQSLINDLPQLEANLLPSLRDTIDRMTRTPSQSDPSSAAASASRLNVPKTSASVRSRSLSPLHATTTQPHPAEQYTSNPATPIPRYQSPAQDQYYFNASSDSPMPTAKYLDKSTRKPSLHRMSPNMDSPSHVHDGGGNSVSSKLARSTLKKPSMYQVTTSTKPENSGHKVAANRNIKSTTQYPHSRSPTVHDFTSNSPSHTAPSRHIIPHDPKQKNSPQPSSIPHHFSQRPILQPQYPTDNSDADRKYETMSHNKLRVVNAEVFSSSSESEVERRARIRARYSEGVNGGQRGGTHGVGLGIDIESSIRKNKSSVASRTQASETESPHIDATNRLRISKSHGPATRAYDKQFIKEARSRREPSRNTPEVPGEHQRRADLLNIVNRMKSEKHVSAVDHEQNGEDDFYEVGIAISGSQDLERDTAESVPQQSIHDDESGYDAEGSSEPTIHHAHARARSSSRTTPQPTSSSTLLSANNDATKGRAALQVHSERPLRPCKSPSLSTQRKDKLGDVSISTSRSPVIPQIVDAAEIIPAALRRHSVYHRSKSPHGLPSKPPSSDAVDKKMPSGSRPVLPASNNVEQRDHSQKHAARADRSFQRRSYEFVPDPLLRQTLTHADSDLSSVGSVYWDDDGSESELSQAAETMFREIGRSQEKDERRSYQNSERNSFRPAGGSGAHSPSHAMQDRHIQEPAQLLRHEERRPRSRSFVAQSGPTEPANGQEADNLHQRQTLIEEIYQAQGSFVNRLQVFIDLFILPLRVQNSKEWITGVPFQVARLFDWLEDIVVLHKQIFGSFKTTCDAQRPNIECVAESVRIFVPRLEVYQPYLVKMADVVGIIEQHMQDDQDDFGEFIGLQEIEPECEGWSVRKFLVEPINLLAKFPEYFSKLLELTPKHHRDYVSTFSLAHSTNVFIRVMMEVKAREDEYALVQKFTSRIQGLPPSTRLATRDRRLLYRGVIFMLDNRASEATGTSTTSDHHSGFGGPNAHVDANNKVSNVTTTNPMRVRSGSLNAIGTAASSVINSPKHPAHMSPAFSPGGSQRGRFNQVLTSTLRTPAPSPIPARRSDDACVQVQAFIFTDLVLFATPNLVADDSCDWTLLDHIGTVKVFDVKTDNANANDSHDPPGVISIEVLPINAHKLNMMLDVEECAIVPLKFVILRDAEEGQASNAISYENRRSAWVSALEQCRKYTLCSLSILSRDLDPQVDVERDKQKTLASLIASGLPMPKSPSMQVQDDIELMPGGTPAVGESEGVGLLHQEQEREERGWWCLRFQQVFREMQRQEIMLAMLV